MIEEVLSVLQQAVCSFPSVVIQQGSISVEGSLFKKRMTCELFERVDFQLRYLESVCRAWSTMPQHEDPVLKFARHGWQHYCRRIAFSGQDQPPWCMVHLRYLTVYWFRQKLHHLPWLPP